MNAALSVNNLTVLYGAQQVLFNVSCTIPQGVLCAIVGPNGAGKTTFIKAVLGLISVHAGTVSFADSKTLSSYRHAIAYIPQHRSLDLDFPIRVIDVVLMGSYAQLGLFSRFTNTEYERAYALIAKVGLEAYANATLGSLSGGQRQRVFLARALMQDAGLYIFDEPFVGVDVATERLIVSLLQELVATGKTVLVVHHDLHTLAYYFDWMILLNKRLIAAGPLKDVFTKDTIESAYNGPLPGGISFLGESHGA